MVGQSRDLTIDVGWKDDKLTRGTRRSAMSMQTLKRSIERSTNDIDRINRRIAAEEEKLERERVAREKRKLAAMEMTGSALIGVGAGMLAATGAAVKAAIDWETAWTGVTKTVSGTPKQMAALEGSLRGLATTLPASHQEIAAVAEAAGQLGVKRGAIVGFTKTMVDLGNTTNLTAEEAATSIAQITNIMGTSQQDVDKFASALVALGNDGASTEAEILEMTKRLAGAGKLIGASETDILALANAMASIGISAEAGGSSMSRVMQKIYESVVEGGDKVEGFAEVAGMSARQFSESFSKDPVSAINAFIKGLNGVEKNGGNVVGTLKALGIRGTEDLRTVLGLKGATDLLSRSLKTGERAWRANRALADEANKRYGTAASQIKIAWNKIKDAAIDAGGAITPIIAGAASKVGDLVHWFTNLPGPVKSALGLLGAFGGTVAIAAGALLLALPRIRDTREALRDLNITGERAKGALGRLGKVAGVAGGAFAVLQGAAMAANAFIDEKSVANWDAYTLALQRFGRSGRVTGEMARLFGHDLGGLDDAFEQLSISGFEKDVNNFFSSLVGGTSAVERAENSFKEVDQVLANLVENGNVQDAGLIFDAIADRAGRFGINTKQVMQMLPGYAGALDVAAQSARNSQGPSGQAAQGIQGIGDAAGDAASETEKLVEELKGLTEPFMATEQAAIEWKQAIADTAKALAENGATLDLNSQKGRDNRQALLGMVGAAQDHIIAMIEEGAQYGAVRRKGEGYRQKLIDTAVQFGLTRGEARKYIDKLFAIPPRRDTKANFNKGQADKNRKTYLEALKGIPREINTDLKVTTRFVSPGLGPTKVNELLSSTGVRNADGGILRFARGAEDHRAQIAPAGAWRLWAEPETGGEAYIPLSPSKRGRSRKILEQVADMFGMQTFAKGGARRSTPRRINSGQPQPTLQTGEMDRLQQKAGLAQQALEDLNQAGLRPLVPSLEEIGKKTSGDVVRSLDLLNKSLPGVSKSTLVSGRSMQATWRANAQATQVSQQRQAGAHMQLRKSLAGLTRSHNADWANMRATSGRSVGTITGPQFGTLHAGLRGVRTGFWNTSASVRDSWSRIRGHTAGPVRFAIRGPINSGIVTAWNNLNRFFAMNKPMGKIPIRFAQGGMYEDHRAQIAPAGAMRLWAEPETQGEAYIPLARSKRRRSAGILGEVADRFGYQLTPRDIARYADGGLWRSMWNIVNRTFPGSTLNSSYRPGDPGWHGQGKAVDVGGNMGAINRWLAARFPQSSELIYTPGINIKNGRRITYSAGVRADHYDHVHWAMANAGLLGGQGAALGAAGYDFRGYLNQQFAGARAQIRSMGTRNKISLAAKTMASKAVDGAVAQAEKQMMQVLGGPGSGVERWRSVGLRALAMTGQSPSLIERLLMQMGSESGGNPRAINNWDINAANGTPSKGLMQVIDPTFQAHRDPRLPNNIWNPLSNIVAAIRYTLARYGSLEAGWRGSGYDNGGVATGKGLLAKKTIKPERVLNPRETESFERLVGILGTKRGMPMLAPRVSGSATGEAIGKAVEAAVSKAVSHIRVEGELVERNGSVVGLMRDVYAQESSDDRKWGR